MSIKKRLQTWTSKKWVRILGIMLTVLAAPVFLYASYRVVTRVRAELALKKATQAQDKGFSLLAAEWLDPFKRELTSRPESCHFALSTYYAARDPIRLEWAAQSCLEQGIETVETFVAIAAARELTGRDQEAVNILLNVAQKFAQSPQPHFRLAQILRRAKQHDEAVREYQEALKRGKDNNVLALEAMVYFTEQKKTKEAYEIALTLKSVETENPEVKLMIAEALAANGDKESAKSLAIQAESALNRLAQAAQTALRKRYESVLKLTR